MRKIIVISGLPGSGKSTLGKLISNHFGFSFLDKDEILETLFRDHENFDLNLRQSLSRQSDLIFQELVKKNQNVVLTSFWRFPGGQSTSGTPSEWLHALSDNIIEIHCQCEVTVALARFINRKRHPGHLDHLRTEADLTNQFKALCKNGPLQIGRVLIVNTSHQLKHVEIFEQIERLWSLI